MSCLTYTTIPLQVKGVSLDLSTIHSLNSRPPILFLHGFGSCKEDLADLPVHSALQQYGFIAYDAPGCGQSTSDKLSGIDIPFLVATAEALLAHFNITGFHLIGHSMGGLTALLLAHRYPDRVLSFVDIKRNLAPEDLLGMFLVLPCPKMFMFGEENRGLSYLGRLEKQGVELAEISESGHFPMYSNPVEMYRRIALFLRSISLD
jgi:pimeloyl-ACP methyl ester carboxylesterase